ncbi:MAG: hypothetical protein ABIF85_03555 [Nanoarchaeota archaeon]|nr:hypothetical protein [Nanoarchaeota archaeon]MBU4451493.1 hypothetical protein [Nanoarchaeota archaeon]MCG2723856.1 hypothetical protein [archaeon]
MKLYLMCYYLAIIMLGLGTGAWCNNKLDLAVAFALAGVINTVVYLRLKKSVL